MSIIPGFASELGMAGGDSIVSVSIFSTTGSVSWPVGATHVSVFRANGGGAGSGGSGVSGAGGNGYWTLNLPKGSNTGLSVNFDPAGPPGSNGANCAVSFDPSGTGIVLYDYSISGGGAQGGGAPTGGGGAGPDGPGASGAAGGAGGAKGRWAPYFSGLTGNDGLALTGNGGTGSSTGSQFGGGGGDLASGGDGGAMLVFSAGTISFVPAVHD